MGTRGSYPPGAFSWIDLATTDAGAAKRFYAGVFGWDFEDTDAGGGAVYTLCRLAGAAVCGLAEMPGDKRAAGSPPAWTSYVSVEDADATASRAAELGGAVVSDAVEVPDAGRMAVLEDPQGAVLALWQPRARIGAERVNDVGCLCMNELVTSDVEAARRFYGDLFGWTVEGPGEPGAPQLVLNAGAINASVFAAPDGTPPHWRVCFAVASAEGAVARVGELGGSGGEPVDIGDGSLAVVRDPQGVQFSLFSGETDP